MAKPGKSRKPDKRKMKRQDLKQKRAFRGMFLLAKLMSQEAAFEKHKKKAFEEIEKDIPDYKKINRFKALAKERIADCKKIQHIVRRRRTLAEKTGGVKLSENAGARYPRMLKDAEADLARLEEKEGGKPKK